MKKLFNFKERDIQFYIEHELKTFTKCKGVFDYVVSNLIKLGQSIEVTNLKDFDFNKMKENEGKNYHWSVIQYKRMTFLIRRYNHHLTIFTKVDKGRNDYYDGKVYEYGAFMIETDFEKFGDKHDEMMEMYWDAPFTDLNTIFHNLVKCIKHYEYSIHGVWNDHSLPTPKHVEIKNIYHGTSLDSIDKFTFAMEELSQIHLCIFAETTILKKLESLKGKEGENLTDRYILKEVRTEVKDEYYHGVGLTVIDTFGGKSKDEWSDVYSLAHFNLEYVFPNGFHLFENEVYEIVEGGELKVGEPCITSNGYTKRYETKFKGGTWKLLKKV